MRNNYIDKIFKFKAVNFDKLTKYGFVRTGDKYVYETLIVDSQFKLEVVIDKDGKLSTSVIEIATGEPYTLFLASGAAGTFVGKVSEEYENVLEDIAKNCFERDVFKSNQAKEIILYIRKKYGDELEFLWEKFSNNAIWRRKDNKKWYALLVRISGNKLGLETKDEVDIIDFRMHSTEIQENLSRTGFISAYHMNKKNWITIVLDGSVSTEEIKDYIDKSYMIANK